MPTRRSRPKTVTDYILAAPPSARAKLRQMRQCIRKAAPEANEGMRWGMPAYSLNRILVMFAGHQHHIGFYPTPSAVKAFKKELRKYHTARGSIQFPYARALPLSLIKKITRFRVQESLTVDRKWRS